MVRPFVESPSVVDIQRVGSSKVRVREQAGGARSLPGARLDRPQRKGHSLALCQTAALAWLITSLTLFSN